MSPFRTAIAALALSGMAVPALALDFTMDFDGIPVAVGDPPPPDQTFGSAVLGFYNNDPVYNRAGAQPWNVTFNFSALAIGSSASGGEGNFEEAHSGCCALGSVSEANFGFELTEGLMLTALAFYYNADGTGSNPAVRLFANGLSVYSQALDECSGGGFCGWTPFKVPDDAFFGQLITRVEFSSTPNKVVFDDVSVSTAPIPEPSTYALMLLGMAALARMARRRAR